MSEATLRGLVKAHEAGRIDRREYILERRRIIDGIVAGEIDLVPYKSPAQEKAAAAAPTGAGSSACACALSTALM